MQDTEPIFPRGQGLPRTVLAPLAVTLWGALVSGCVAPTPLEVLPADLAEPSDVVEVEAGPAVPAGPAVSGEQPPVIRFDPDEVALRATQAIDSYLQTTDAITADGGENPERMAAMVTDNWLPTELSAFALYRDRAIRTLGVTRFDSLIVQSARTPVAGGVEVAAVICVDATAVWVVGRDVPDPPETMLAWLLSGDDDTDVDDAEFALWTEYLATYDPQPGVREPIVVWLVGPSLADLRVDTTTNWEGAHSCTQITTE